MEQVRKKPTPLYEPFLKELVIPDLEDAGLNGSFDKDVLLFQQDCYVARALREKGDVLRCEFKRINETERGDDGARDSLKREAVIEATKALYVELKEMGDQATGVRGFAGAAGVYLKGAIVDYHTYLLDMAEHVSQAVLVGHSPDINWLSGHTYAVVAKASTATNLIETILGRAESQYAYSVLEMGVNAVGSSSQDAVSMGIGRRIWQGVEAIAKNPQVHVVNEMAKQSYDSLEAQDVWDVDPMERQEFEP